MSSQLLPPIRSSSVTSFANDFNLPPPPPPLGEQPVNALGLPSATEFSSMHADSEVVVFSWSTGATKDSALQTEDGESDYFSLVRAMYDHGDTVAVLEGLGNAVKIDALGLSDHAAREQSPAASTIQHTRSKTLSASTISSTNSDSNGDANSTPKTTRTLKHPLLKTTSTTKMSSSQNYGTISSILPEASSSTTRPRLPHAHTTAAIPHAAPTTSLSTPPTTHLTNPTATSSTAPTSPAPTTRQALPPPKPTRPSLFRSLTTTLTLDLHTPTSHTTLHAPPPPSHWAPSHRAPLLSTWDTIRATPALSLASQLAETEKQFLAAFPELGTGEVVLGRAWVVHVLGTGLRAPFWSGEGMGRWEVLGGIARGAGGAWGMM